MTAKITQQQIDITLEYAHWILLWHQIAYKGSMLPTFTIDVVHQYQKTGRLSQAQCAGIHNIYKSFHVDSWRKKQAENALELLTIPPAEHGWMGGIIAGM